MPDENELEMILDKNMIPDEEIPFACCGNGYCDIPELSGNEGENGEQYSD